jgi:hypothetical protein
MGHSSPFWKILSIQDIYPRKCIKGKIDRSGEHKAKQYAQKKDRPGTTRPLAFSNPDDSPGNQQGQKEKTKCHEGLDIRWRHEIPPVSFLTGLHKMHRQVL